MHDYKKAKQIRFSGSLADSIRTFGVSKNTKTRFFGDPDQEWRELTTATLTLLKYGIKLPMDLVIEFNNEKPYPKGPISPIKLQDSGADKIVFPVSLNLGTLELLIEVIADIPEDVEDEAKSVASQAW